MESFQVFPISVFELQGCVNSISFFNNIVYKNSVAAVINRQKRFVLCPAHVLRIVPVVNSGVSKTVNWLRNVGSRIMSHRPCVC